MNKGILKSVNTINETFLFVVVLSVFASSFYIATNIQISPKQNSVLGISIPNAENKFELSEILPNSNYSIKFDENQFEIDFDITLKNVNSKSNIIDLGKLYNDKNEPHNYRLSLLSDEEYLNDFNAYLLVNTDQYDLLVDGQYYTNNLMLSQSASSNVRLKIVQKKQIQGKINLDLKIYK
jgi:hypothetical protein